MAELELGRVQGASIFYTIAEPDEDNHIYTRNLRPEEGFVPQLSDLVIMPNGDLRHIIGFGSNYSYVVVGQVCGSILGPEGPEGTGLSIKAHYDSEEELPEPSEEYYGYGAAMLVGTSVPYEIYICTYEADELVWKDIGNIQGPRGEQGVAGEVYVDGTITLAPDEEAYVDSNGTASQLHLTFGIPQGVQGEQGEVGPVGYIGLSVVDGILHCNSNDDIDFALDGNGNLNIVI